MLNNYKTTQVRNTEIRLFQTANIVADTYKENTNDIIFTRMMVRSYGRQANARILVLDSNKKVLVDNYYDYIGSVINSEEVRSSLIGESVSNLYTLDDREVLQLSVPIISNLDDEVNISGAVVISADMDSINNNVESLKEDIIKIATSALAISLFLTFIATNNITKPLRDLTYGVEKISSGDLGYRIKRKTKDELGKLIETFNNMSNTLSTIEKGRKDFINSISHELKTPLTSIKVLIESLNIGNNDIETYDEYLEDIHGEVERMEELVNYLMKSIKLEDIVLNMKEENIGLILKDTIKLISSYAERNNVSLEFKNIEDVSIICDKDKIKEVILNLIDNSIKYRDPKKYNNYVSITLKKFTDKAIITIEDNGIGIDEESLSDIFERGFRVLEGPIQSKDNVEGYGVGLTLVKNILDKHNWQISVKSSLEDGSIFKITIPI